jgi:heme/copper-type cytochrome/quinol oxidase subunit 2
MPFRKKNDLFHDFTIELIQQILLTLLPRTTRHFHLDTTEILIPNTASPSSAKQSSGYRTIFKLIVFILISFCIFVLMELFLGPRYGRSYYSTYGFLDGLIYAIRDAAIGMVIMIVICLVATTVMFCCCRNGSKSKKNQTEPNRT